MKNRIHRSKAAAGRKALRQCLALGVFLTMLCAGESNAAAAERTYRTEIPAQIDLGQVAIKLSDLELDEDGQEVPMEAHKQVMPGQTVDRIIRIHNLGNDAWIRAKLIYSGPDGLPGYSDEDMRIWDTAWVRQGEWWYYSEPVFTGESIDFLRQFVVPAEWDIRYAEKEFGIHAVVNAVQTDNFTPDFDSGEPWFGTLIEERVFEDFAMKPEGREMFRLEFRGGAEGFFKNTEDFMANFGTLLPGDTAEDRLEIGNAYSRAVDLWFYTEYTGEDILAREVELTILDQSGKVLYQGPLSETAQKLGAASRVLLGHFATGEETELLYRIRVPEHLQNRFALSKTKTRWILEASLSEETQTDGGTQLQKVSDAGGGSGGRNAGVITFPREKPPETSAESSGGPSNQAGVLGILRLPDTEVGIPPGRQVLGAARQLIRAARTGDPADLLAAGFVLAASGFGLVIMGISIRRFRVRK